MRRGPPRHGSAGRGPAAQKPLISFHFRWKGKRHCQPQGPWNHFSLQTNNFWRWVALRGHSGLTTGEAVPKGATDTETSLASCAEKVTSATQINSKDSITTTSPSTMFHQLVKRFQLFPYWQLLGGCQGILENYSKGIFPVLCRSWLGFFFLFFLFFRFSLISFCSINYFKRESLFQY